ncbi:hypothetical protein MLD38_037872 [Melastoma candidum]|uniref:Uncharacterized protein n=1 Tax=Melastoma candidum TaxID=119954 RepID=A0ACB9LQM4_9MYRT|nr:hypothetical protein MLD38_037872 [Melastoma candidum]
MRRPNAAREDAPLPDAASGREEGPGGRDAPRTSLLDAKRVYRQPKEGAIAIRLSAQIEFRTPRGTAVGTGQGRPWSASPYDAAWRSCLRPTSTKRCPTGHHPPTVPHDQRRGRRGILGGRVGGGSGGGRGAPPVMTRNFTLLKLMYT